MPKWEEETRDWLFYQGASETQIENAIDCLDALEEGA